MNKRGYGLQSESGQTIIEYVLLLVVVITLALLLTSRFFKPFRDWANFYVGDYIECLLDEGELPSLGGDSKIQECDRKRGDDRAFANGGKGARPGENQDGKSPDTGKKNQNDQRPNSQQASSHENFQSYNGGPMRPTPVRGTDGADFARRSKVSVAEAETRAEKDRYFRVDHFDTGMRVGQGKAQKVYGLSGLLESEREKIKKREQKIQKVAEMGGGDGAGKKAKKFTFEPKTRKVAGQDLDMDDWSFGKLLRILLILVIIIALGLFIAGQLVQISKSMEK